MCVFIKHDMVLLNTTTTKKLLLTFQVISENQRKTQNWLFLSSAIVQILLFSLGRQLKYLCMYECKLARIWMTDVYCQINWHFDQFEYVVVQNWMQFDEDECPGVQNWTARTAGLQKSLELQWHITNMPSLQCIVIFLFVCVSRRRVSASTHCTSCYQPPSPAPMPSCCLWPRLPMLLLSHMAPLRCLTWWVIVVLV